MKYIIRGVIKKHIPTVFEINVEAESERHARTLALIKLGSKQKLKKNSINIQEVKPA